MELSILRRDPEYYIDQYFGELIRQVDIRRESLIAETHTYSAELINSMEKLKLECAKNSVPNTEDVEILKLGIRDNKFYTWFVSPYNTREIFGKIACTNYDADKVEVPTLFL